MMMTMTVVIIGSDSLLPRLWRVEAPLLPYWQYQSTRKVCSQLSSPQRLYYSSIYKRKGTKGARTIFNHFFVYISCGNSYLDTFCGLLKTYCAYSHCWMYCKVDGTGIPRKRQTSSTNLIQLL